MGNGNTHRNHTDICMHGCMCTNYTLLKVCRDVVSSICKGNAGKGVYGKGGQIFACVCTNILELIQETLLTHFPAGFPPVHTEAVVVRRPAGHCESQQFYCVPKVTGPLHRHEIAY